jgi:hypothetical protein
MAREGAKVAKELEGRVSRVPFNAANGIQRKGARGERRNTSLISHPPVPANVEPFAIKLQISNLQHPEKFQASKLQPIRCAREIRWGTLSSASHGVSFPLITE